ncbi:UNVERIFIED_CONTAM: type II toxin-antitoxin system death-on-curing family toxin, partial [Kocuria sp. CPCC 205274]
MIDLQTVRLIHDKMIENYGGLPGMADADRISGVLGRVENLLHYEGHMFDQFNIAALYLMAIARAHIFNDANKRTALGVALYYLQREGIQLRKDEWAQLM